jgi:Spy/CpxP family protein refolding chaperone
MKKFFIGSLLFGMVSLFPGLANAEPGDCPCAKGEGDCACMGGGPGPGPGFGPGGEMGPDMDDGRFQKMQGRLLREKVGLTEDEAAKVEAVFAKGRDAHKKVRTQMGEAQKALHELLKADSNDMAAYTKAINAMESSKAEMEKLMDSHKAEISKILNPKQQAKLMMAMHHLMKKAHRGGHKGHRGHGGHHGDGPGDGPGEWRDHQGPMEQGRGREKNKD